MDKYIDLHTHTNISDGVMTPTELIWHAKESGLSAIALTDHDTTCGLAEAERAAEEAGIELIPGIELSADYDGEMHIVGLFIDRKSPALAVAHEKIQEYRAIRTMESIRRLQALGFPITLEEVCALKPGGTVYNLGRIHMARLLVEKGCFTDVREVFDKYLGTGCPAFYSKQPYSPAECIDLIHRMGGVAIWAHPYLIAKTKEELLPIFNSLLRDGLDGMECMYNSHPYDYEEMCFNMCREHSILASAGSDFHGSNKPHVHIGRVYGDRPIPYSILEKIKTFYENRL